MGKKEDVSKMHAYLQKEAESTRGKVKRMLLEWGASLDQCGRKQEEIRKILRLKAECEGLAAEVKSRSMEKGFSLIEEAYDHNIAVLQEKIERKLTEKRKIDGMVALLSKEEQELLFLRYQKGYGYDYIALKLNMGRSTCFRIHDRILTELADKLESDGFFCDKCEKN